MFLEFDFRVFPFSAVAGYIIGFPQQTKDVFTFYFLETWNETSSPFGQPNRLQTIVSHHICFCCRRSSWVRCQTSLKTSDTHDELNQSHSQFTVKSLQRWIKTKHRRCEEQRVVLSTSIMINWFAKMFDSNRLRWTEMMRWKRFTALRIALSTEENYKHKIQLSNGRMSAFISMSLRINCIFFENYKVQNSLTAHWIIQSMTKSEAFLRFYFSIFHDSIISIFSKWEQPNSHYQCKHQLANSILCKVQKMWNDSFTRRTDECNFMPLRNHQQTIKNLIHFSWL